MANTPAYLRRLAESHRTTHDLCDARTCAEAKKLADALADDLPSADDADEAAWAVHCKALLLICDRFGIDAEALFGTDYAGMKASAGNAAEDDITLVDILAAEAELKFMGCDIPPRPTIVVGSNGRRERKGF